MQLRLKSNWKKSRAWRRKSNSFRSISRKLKNRSQIKTSSNINLNFIIELIVLISMYHKMQFRIIIKTMIATKIMSNNKIKIVSIWIDTESNKKETFLFEKKVIKRARDSVLQYKAYFNICNLLIDSRSNRILDCLFIW